MTNQTNNGLTDKNGTVAMRVNDLDRIVADWNAGRISFFDAEAELTFVWDFAIRHGISSDLAAAVVASLPSNEVHG